MNKTQLVDALAVKTGLNQNKLILNAVSGNIGYGRIVVEF